MTGSSADIKALLIDVNDLSNPTPDMLPAIFRDIIGRLDAAGLGYAVVGRIAMALALIKYGTADLSRVQRLLRQTDDMEKVGHTRLRLAIGSAVLSTICTFGRYVTEERARLDPHYVPVWRRLQAEAADDDDR